MSDLKIVNLGGLSSEDVMLIAKAKEALRQAYAPYSGFQVATAILLDNGAIVTGTNQENAAYPSGMCAERVALYAFASQYPKSSITKLVVVASLANDTELTPATACGGCRQVMLEFEHRQHEPYEVIMYYDHDQWVVSKSAEALLPYSFKKSNLDK
ncbi:MAG: cytidine deaminase [Chryseolinea sp.]